MVLHDSRLFENTQSDDARYKTVLLIETEKVGCEEMEGSFGGGGGGGDDGVGKNGGPSDGRLPNPFAGAYRQFLGGALGGSPCKSALVRHDSLAKTTLLDVTIEVEKSNECCETDFFPILRSLVVANAGDCRAVLCRRGKAIDMSQDHKPACSKERKRIEALGGHVYDGYLNGLLNVARAIGDWHINGMKDRDGSGPLSAEPEVMKMWLTEDDEFLILGCDGIWDVFLSQNAVDFARRKLQEHNDPAACCKELVDEALKRKSSDNLAVVLVCFQSKPPPVLTAPRRRVQRSISAEGLRELQSFLDSLAD
ncbi:hypothetical protein BHM03_00000806 [Ensete ventricosum]|nr:hypothetical protein BHM03_00000806 [Ensete ventricosum]